MYPSTLECKGHKVRIKLSSWKWQAGKEKAFVLLSRWFHGWHHRWQLSALTVVTEGEGRTYESEGFAALNVRIHGERQKVPDRASNRLGKPSWVPWRVTCTRRTQVRAPALRSVSPYAPAQEGAALSQQCSQGFLWTSRKYHFTCLWINLVQLLTCANFLLIIHFTNRSRGLYRIPSSK